MLAIGCIETENFHKYQRFTFTCFVLQYAKNLLSLRAIRILEYYVEFNCFFLVYLLPVPTKTTTLTHLNYDIPN